MIAGRLPGRTDNEIKNYWNTNIGKKIQGGGHQPSSTTSRKPKTLSNDDDEKLPNNYPTKGHSKASQPSTHRPTIDLPNSTRVVRTKASRCTKVVVPAALHPQKLHHRQLDHHDDDPTKPVLVREPSMDVDDHDRDDQVKDEQMVGLQVPLLPLNSDDNYNNSSEFMTDFELDESFLSDLPNFDFFHLTYFGNEAGDDLDHNDNNFDRNVITAYEKGRMSSPKSDDLAAEDMMYGVDLGTMASVVDPEVLDWIRD